MGVALLLPWQQERVPMSFHFSANQYEGAFSAQRLQNYEVPAPLNKEWPSTREGSTTIISNDEGHILVEDKRSSATPWGTFVGTWQTERKPIVLMTRTKLQNHLSNVQYITNPNKTKDKSEVPALQDQSCMLEHEPCTSDSPRSGQLEAEKCSEKSPSPSRPESRMGVAGTQSPLGSRPPTNASTSCST